MPKAELNAPARQALIALLLHSEDVTNPILKAHFRLEIRKPEREQLRDAGLITVPGRDRNANIYRLTPKGRERARAELTESAPEGTGAGVHLLYAMANVLDRVMVQYGLDADKVFGAIDAPLPAPQEDVEGQVLAAYSSLAKRRGDLVSLVRLRDRLPGVDRETLDAALKSMDRRREIQLEPDPNHKSLPSEAREAALRLGGEDKHFIRMGHR
jgi:hypothetical protein